MRKNNRNSSEIKSSTLPESQKKMKYEGHYSNNYWKAKADPSVFSRKVPAHK